MDFCRKQVLSDCEELLRRFQQTQSVRFDVFSNIWREMNFSHIFYGTTHRESRRFSRLILDLAFTFFRPPFSFQIRVGGLYLLHSLYWTQTASPPQQIRITLKDWEEVKKFENDAMAAHHMDVVYVLRRLEFCKAFHYTAMPHQLMFLRKKKVRRRNLDQDFVERTARPQELINMELLEEMSNVHKLYQKLKTSLVPSSEALADPSLHLVQEDLVPQLQDTVMDFCHWQQRMDVVDEVKVEDSGEGTSSEQSSQRSQLLASIKSRAYGEAAQACKSRRHRQVEVDVTTQEAGPKDNTPKGRKTTLKAKVNHMLGKSCSNGLDVTRITRLTVLDSYRKRVERKRFTWK